MLTLNDKNYKEKIKTGRFVIDAWQDGCSICTDYSPVFRACEDMVEGVKFAQFKVTNASSEFRREFLKFEKDEFAGSPTTILVEDGKMVRRIAGYVNVLFLMEFITTGMPRPLSELSTQELEALGFRTIKSIEAFEALKKDSIGLMTKIHEETGNR